MLIIIQIIMEYGLDKIMNIKEAFLLIPKKSILRTQKMINIR